MRYHEKLNIVIMRDNGPRRNFQIRRSNFFLLIILFFCLPCLCLLLTTQCWLLWQENIDLRAAIDKATTDYQLISSKAERLKNLESLLGEENIKGKDILVRQLASSSAPPAPFPATDIEDKENEVAEGKNPDLPIIDSGRIKISDVQIRIAENHILRISLDLRNPDNMPLITGKITGELVFPDGDREALIFTPPEAGSFRISRFKQAVLRAQPRLDPPLANAKVVLTITDQNDKEIFKNIYPLNS